MSDVSVVVPLYNEEQSVAMLQRELADALTGLDYEIILWTMVRRTKLVPGSQPIHGPGFCTSKKMPDKARLFRRSAGGP